MEYREEHDSMGRVPVPADRLWGAQTERSRLHFPFGKREEMPREIIHAFGLLKGAAACANAELCPDGEIDGIDLALLKKMLVEE